MPQLCLSIAFQRASPNKCQSFLQRPRLYLSSIRPAFLEVGPSYTPEQRLILKSRFTDLIYQPPSCVFVSLSLKMNFQLQFWGIAPMENWVNTGTGLWYNSQHLNICLHPGAGCGVLVSSKAVWKVVEIFCLCIFNWNKIFWLRWNRTS